MSLCVFDRFLRQQIWKLDLKYSNSKVHKGLLTTVRVFILLVEFWVDEFVNNMYQNQMNIYKNRPGSDQRLEI